ncbi:hypothetical protein QYF61_024660 [Mycteria americana]|uniref:RNase H type-1 domain-containing protein n=1 Tax=Mycteria americana TaxID=33587 RepID=A0AAN7NFR6_MYCAM|nr:hypothetical protein QYF61_024660 [Mycteria americana]
MLQSCRTAQNNCTDSRILAHTDILYESVKENFKMCTQGLFIIWKDSVETKSLLRLCQPLQKDMDNRVEFFCLLKYKKKSQSPMRGFDRHCSLHKEIEPTFGTKREGLEGFITARTINDLVFSVIYYWANNSSKQSPRNLELIMDWPEGKDFRISPEEEVTRAEEAPLYNKLPENEKQYALSTDGSCCLVGKHQRWKAAVWSPIQQVVETAEGEGESSQFAEVKAIQLALAIAEREKWPVLYLYTDSWMVANALWGWLQQWKQSNWQCRKKPIWAAALWQDIAALVENLFVKVCHVDAHIPKSWATEEQQNNQQVDQAAKIEVAQVDLDWQHKGLHKPESSSSEACPWCLHKSHRKTSLSSSQANASFEQTVGKQMF